jgi:hypothetical protein
MNRIFETQTKLVCPVCKRKEVIETSFEEDIIWESIVWECQYCYAIATLVIHNSEYNSVQVGINALYPDEIEDTTILHLARNLDEAWEWYDDNVTFAADWN